MTAGFTPPPLVWETLTGLKDVAEAFPGGAIDLTIGTPFDPPPAAVVHALGHSGTERGYPASIGSPAYREGAAAWMHRRLGVEVPPEQVAATIGSKEFVAGVPQWLRLRSPERDTVLYPAISYPTYAMGAQLAGLRAVAVPVGADGRSDLDAVAADDVARALCLWVEQPGQPHRQARRPRGRSHVGSPAWRAGVQRRVLRRVHLGTAHRRTILEHGLDGVVAVHSLSKRSNLAGARCGFVAGDADLVGYLGQLRKHAGFMVPGPVQASRRWWPWLTTNTSSSSGRATAPGSSSWSARSEPRGSTRRCRRAPSTCGSRRRTGTALKLTRWFAERTGILVTPGATYGPDGAPFVRLALVQPDERIRLAGERLVAG